VRAARALALLLAASCSNGASSPTVVTPVGNTPTPAPTEMVWSQVWSDEFDGAAGTLVDPAKWNYDLADGCSSGNCGWGNNEKEYYTNSAQNVSLNGQGQLAIVARAAPAGLSCYYGACRYTSAKIHTRGKMTAVPGRVEARIKLPLGQGLWPAFWMLGEDFPTTPWPAAGELDIMEFKGSIPSSSSSAVHGPGYSGNTPFARTTSLASGTFGDDYHVFAVEWTSDQVTFYVDDRAHYNVSNAQMRQFGNPVLNKAYYVILNLAVGGNFDGDPKSDAMLPATMLVDYVRVFRQVPK
jgi:beta-glucanase (GH16 family)